MNVNEIIKKLKEYEIAYYEGNPLVSDEEFDLLKDELRTLDPLNSYFDEVGEEDMNQSTFEKISHGIYQMGSLDKVSNIEEFKKWDKNEFYPIRIDEKEDGSSIKIIYQDGKFIKAITRGNGEYGFDVTENVRHINFPKTINEKGLLILRGEVIFTHENYKKVSEIMNKNGDKISKSPRNLAAGLLKRKDDFSLLSYLTIRFYDVMNNNCWSINYSNIPNFIKNIFPNNTTTSKLVYNNKELLDYYNDYNNSIRASLDRDIDGLVLYTKTNEKIAFKFPAIIKQTTLVNIKWQVGVSGRVTPVGIINPVELNGAIITNVSLYNVDYIKQSGLTINSKVGICRRGDVIPKIVDIYDKIGTPISIPNICPICGSRLENQDKYLICINNDCGSKIIGKIIKWFKIHDVKDIGEKTIQTLYENNIFKDMCQFLYIEKGLLDNEILKIEGIGEKLLNILKENIKKTLKTTLINFITGLNIDGIDKKIIEKIIINTNKEIITLEDFVSIIKNTDELLKIKGLGNLIIDKIQTGIKNKETEIKLLNTILHIEPYKKIINTKLSNKLFVVTGTLSQPRKYFENVIKDNGGRFSNTLTKDTNYIIVGENAGSKIVKAKEWGIKILTEEEFNGLI